MEGEQDLELQLAIINSTNEQLTLVNEDLNQQLDNSKTVIIGLETSVNALEIELKRRDTVISDLKEKLKESNSIPPLEHVFEIPRELADELIANNIISNDSDRVTVDSSEIDMLLTKVSAHYRSKITKLEESIRMKDVLLKHYLITMVNPSATKYCTDSCGKCHEQMTDLRVLCDQQREAIKKYELDIENQYHKINYFKNSINKLKEVLEE